jgi:hypothetical protein
MSLKGKSFAKYVVQYVRKGSAGRDRTKNWKISTMNQI